MRQIGSKKQGRQSLLKGRKSENTKTLWPSMTMLNDGTRKRRGKKELTGNSCYIRKPAK
jgi:hypothetical protein